MLGYVLLQCHIYVEENQSFSASSMIYTVSEDNRALYFESQESMDLYLKYASQNIGVKGDGDYEVTWNEVVNETKTQSDGWIGTITSDWDFKSSYILPTSEELSVNLVSAYKNIGFSVGVSNQYNYSVTIAANSQYPSKLALWQTYTITNRTITYYVNGTYWRSETYNVVTKSGDATIGACYESIYPACGSAL